MAKYLLLIYGNEQRWETMTAAERAEIDEGHRQFWGRAGSSILASGELEPSTTATTLRAPSGDAAPSDGPSITDGPFLESKEVLGGFYVVDVPDLDTALDLASGLAEASHDHSGVQVQPLVDHG
ncbi:YciI family protein [Luteimicrobium sp. DT211]|uniref:YciI family protein n=1 Tax=Luteimicrobium sp. DT211 TaxID=3393412 RepID=UPI003CEC6705